jgi:hypothetical protein
VSFGADNVKLERQLDDAGRKGATLMGEAIRALRIPIGIVMTSRLPRIFLGIPPYLFGTRATGAAIGEAKPIHLRYRTV